MKKWEVINSEIMSQNKWMKLIKDKCIINDKGDTYDYYWVDANNFAAIVGTTEDGKVVLIEQYRHGAKEILIEFPAGLIEKGEDTIETAKRELLEETGYRADDIIFIKELFSSSGMLSSKGYLFFARNIKKVDEQKLEVTENINVKLMDFDELNDLINTGKIKGAFGTAVALLALQNRDWFLGK